MTLDHTLLWQVSRMSGMVAYLLVAASVCLGLLLSLKVRSKSWPRFVTDGLHRHVTLLGLILTGLHTVTIWLDPFTSFTPAEVLVPMASHYRPLWIAMGIVASYLLVAVWASEWVRPHVGYAWWRRFHYVSFAAFLLITLHGLGTGSDTRTAWGVAIYLVASAAVLLLLAWRIAVAVPAEQRLPSLATLLAGSFALALWTVVAPLQPGWNAIANNGNGNGQVLATTASAGGAGGSGASGVELELPFLDTFSATLDGSGSALDGPLTGDYPGSLHIAATSAGNPTLELRLADGPTCSGSVTGADRSQLFASCRTDAGQQLTLVLAVSRSSSTQLQGQLQASGATATNPNVQLDGEHEDHEHDDD
ncbi:MAG TPA: ferric reductase-like transmembrane domain-containing protein [Solirubrobacterales bacterium]|nr:ferric reductase-like transmembrane domain-containing protein [Solirubrobacterales bacterium]